MVMEGKSCRNFVQSTCVKKLRNRNVDQKPQLQLEEQRIQNAGGFIHAGRVNGSLNLMRAIGYCLWLSISSFLQSESFCVRGYGVQESKRFPTSQVDTQAQAEVCEFQR